MENNKEDIKEKSIDMGEVKDSEVFSFGYLVNVILDYYCETSIPLDPADDWKKGTVHEEKESPEIPKDIDEMIKKAFKSQLKKFIK